MKFIKKYVGENILKIKDFFNDIYRYFQINDREESESQEFYIAKFFKVK